MRNILTLFLLVLSFDTFAQGAITYYDNNGHQSAKEDALYYREINKNNGIYEFSYYWTKSQTLKSRYTSTDTVGYLLRVGKSVGYFENGQLEDSSNYYEPGKLYYAYKYYPNGQIFCYTIYDPAKGNYNSKGFKDDGTLIPNFVFQKIAEFPGGLSEWTRYLEKHLVYDIAFRKGAPPGDYRVQVSFTIDRDGKIIDVRAANDPGYGTMEEAIRVIQNGPAWLPAQQYGKTVIYRHKQSITFRVSQSR